MKPVIQEELTGCGIASVAALAGVTYQQTKSTANRLGCNIESVAVKQVEVEASIELLQRVMEQ